jgi:transposase
MARHPAATHFGVAVGAAIAWVRRLRETGGAAPGQLDASKNLANSEPF